MKTKQIIVLVVALSILLGTTAIEAKKWKKEDFDKLEGKDRVFHLSAIELVVNGAQFSKSLDEELGFILKHKNNTLPASIQVDKLKKSLETEFGIEVDHTGFDEKYNKRMENGFFATEPSYQGALFSYNWNLDNKENRIEISISIFKVGTRIEKNKAQVTIQIMQYDPEKGEYKALTTIKGKRESWEKQTEIYEIIKKSCSLT